MADQNHVRAEKTTTYLAASGAVGGALWVVGVGLSFPLLGAGMVVGAVVAATSEKGRNFLQKVGDQLINLGNDMLSHVTEDYNRVQNWWQRRSAAKTAAKLAKTQAPTGASTFKPGSAKPGFDAVAQPGIVAETPKVSAPAPKPDLGPKT